MAPLIPSIQSFFQPEVPPTTSRTPSTISQPTNTTGDGFTPSEIHTALHPSLHAWHPRTTYTETDIGSLVPGPGCVTVMGRVANVYDQVLSSKMPQAAKGCAKVLVKDDSGALAVKLWYAKVDYGLRLGQLVSIWTPHVSNAEAGSLVGRDAVLVTSIFPERDNTCYFLVQEKSDEGVLCKTPLGYRERRLLEGLITLRSYLEGGWEVQGVKVLVAVRSIGGRKKFTTKKGTQTENVSVNVFDDTADAVLTLWGRTSNSASHLKASHTVLLITNPSFKGDRRPTLSLNHGTIVDVDPWSVSICLSLKEVRLKLAGDDQRLMRAVFDLEAISEAQNQILFTLADVDEFVRAAPSEIFSGFLSLTIIELNISALHQRNMLLCTECCGLPVFSNALTTPCKQCSKQLTLRPNPRLIGLLVDETGAIMSGKLIWSDIAWEQLLGRNAEDLAEAAKGNLVLLRYLEQRVLFLKVAVRFGWVPDVGRLCVLALTIV
ncbi:hypothetical protein MMC21_000050 [Puttea exsequens]|nr:hypothetical protein [Puttea exsequens]